MFQTDTLDPGLAILTSFSFNLTDVKADLDFSLAARTARLDLRADLDNGGAGGRPELEIEGAVRHSKLGGGSSDVEPELGLGIVLGGHIDSPVEPGSSDSNLLNIPNLARVLPDSARHVSACVSCGGSG